MPEKAMTVQELKKHIESVTLPMIQETVGEKVKDVVAKAVEESLTPIRSDITKAQAERQELVDQIKRATTGDSQLSNGKHKREKGEAFGRVVWALRRAKNDPAGAISILNKSGDNDLAELMATEAKRWEPEAGKALR